MIENLPTALLFGIMAFLVTRSRRVNSMDAVILFAAGYFIGETGIIHEILSAGAK